MWTPLNGANTRNTSSFSVFRGNQFIVGKGSSQSNVCFLHQYTHTHTCMYKSQPHTNIHIHPFISGMERKTNWLTYSELCRCVSVGHVHILIDDIIITSFLSLHVYRPWSHLFKMTRTTFVASLPEVIDLSLCVEDH